MGCAELRHRRRRQAVWKIMPLSLVGARCCVDGRINMLKAIATMAISLANNNWVTNIE